MSEEVFLLTSLPSDLYLNDFPRAIQDNGRIEPGGEFSLSKPPVSKFLQQVSRFEPQTTSAAR